MSLGQRTVLYVGASPCLVHVHTWPRRPRVLSVHPSPVAPNLSNRGDWNELSPWLAESCPRGATVDVIFQNHVLRCESFPPLGSAGIEGALGARFKRDLLMPLDGLLAHSVRVDSAKETQAVFAARQRSSYASVCTALGEAGLIPGRLGFAGQLALRALDLRCRGAGWTIVPEVTFASNCLLAKGPEGQLLVAALPHTSSGPASARELLKAWIPKLDGDATGPVELSVPEPGKQPSLAGPTLPSPLDFILPVFLEERAWRVASAEDLEYPYYFGKGTWAAAAALGLLLGWTGTLGYELFDISTVTQEVQTLTRQKASQATTEADLKTKLSTLDFLEKDLSNLGAERFDNAAWLHWVGQVRDSSAPELLFESVNVSGETIALSGRHTAAEPVLGFFKELAQTLGERQARFRHITRQADGTHLFSVQVVREESSPPALDSEGGS